MAGIIDNQQLQILMGDLEQPGVRAHVQVTPAGKRNKFMACLASWQAKLPECRRAQALSNILPRTPVRA